MGMALNTIELSLLRDNHLRFIASLTVDWNAVNTNVDGDEIESLLTDTVAAHLCQAIAT